MANKLKIGETQDKFTNKLFLLKWIKRREVFMLIAIHENKIKITEMKDYKENIKVKLEL